MVVQSVIIIMVGAATTGITTTHRQHTWHCFSSNGWINALEHDAGRRHFSFCSPLIRSDINDICERVLQCAIPFLSLSPFHSLRNFPRCAPAYPLCLVFCYRQLPWQQMALSAVSHRPNKPHTSQIHRQHFVSSSGLLEWFAFSLRPSSASWQWIKPLTFLESFVINANGEWLE